MERDTFAVEPQDARTLPAFSKLGRDSPISEPKTYRELVKAVAAFMHAATRIWCVTVETQWHEGAPLTQWSIWDGEKTIYRAPSPQGAFAALRAGRAPLEAVDAEQEP